MFSNKEPARFRYDYITFSVIHSIIFMNLKSHQPREVYNFPPRQIRYFDVSDLIISTHTWSIENLEYLLFKASSWRYQVPYTQCNLMHVRYMTWRLFPTRNQQIGRCKFSYDVRNTGFYGEKSRFPFMEGVSNKNHLIHNQEKNSMNGFEFRWRA